MKTLVGALRSLLKVKKVVAESGNFQQVAAEVEITRDVSRTKSLALIMGLDGYAR